MPGERAPDPQWWQKCPYLVPAGGTSSGSSTPPVEPVTHLCKLEASHGTKVRALQDGSGACRQARHATAECSHLKNPMVRRAAGVKG
ncbi:MAG: hypothetical protein WDA75_10225 [Candidatus Latescibacterota bacterium]|jgi:hypothetical protein